MLKKSLGYARCPYCDIKISITYLGKIMSHFLPFNGDHYAVCPGSGMTYHVEEERGIKSGDKYTTPEWRNRNTAKEATP